MTGARRSGFCLGPHLRAVVRELAIPVQGVGAHAHVAEPRDLPRRLRLGAVGGVQDAACRVRTWVCQTWSE